MWRSGVFSLGLLNVSRRCFGNAPNRVRPVETPRIYALRQTEREVSVVVALAVMFVVPVWFIALSGFQGEQKREGVKQWAKEHQQHSGE